MKKIKLTKQEIASIVYHGRYDYPMTRLDLDKWKVKKSLAAKTNTKDKISFDNNYFYLSTRKKIIYLRAKRDKYSGHKLKQVKNYIWIFKSIPTILFVGVTGSLAMDNAKSGSDIDLMLICKNESLWMSRALVYMALILFNIPFRRFNEMYEKDKLCLNIWLEEGNMVWSKKDRNLYTAHEILQIKPLVNKKGTFETFMHKNKWVRNYWEGEQIRKPEANRSALVGYKKKIGRWLRLPLNRFLYSLQYIKMRNKITNERISANRALFHPRIIK